MLGKDVRVDVVRPQLSSGNWLPLTMRCAGKSATVSARVTGQDAGAGTYGIELNPAVGYHDPESSLKLRLLSRTSLRGEQKLIVTMSLNGDSAMISNGLAQLLGLVPLTI
jgi:hypothetical protein